MKILLIGDFSGIYKNLKKGFLALGHDVTLLADGDGWKSIPGADGRLFSPSQGFVSRLNSRLIEPFRREEFNRGYDATFVVNLGFFNPLIIEPLLSHLRKSSKKLFLSACGGDYAVYKAYSEGAFNYYSYDGVEENRYRNYWQWRRFGAKKELGVIAKYFDAVVPISYEYEIGYHSSGCTVCQPIPLPVDLSECLFRANIPGEKVVFFHGRNQEKIKGTEYIKEAFAVLCEKYPDDVEAIVSDRLPYREYLEAMSRVNVVVDQCKSYGYGLNACLALAQGKVVLSASTRQNTEALRLGDNCPVLHIEPDVEQIVSQLEFVVKSRDRIPEMGLSGRDFVERYHNAEDVARHYIQVIEGSWPLVSR